MKKLTILAAIVALTAMAGTAMGQVVHGDPGDMNPSFDDTGTLTTLEPAVFGVFPVYIVLWGVPDVFGMEYSYNTFGTMLLDNQTSPNPQWITGDATFNATGQFDNVKAGTGLCVDTQPLYVLQCTFFLYFATTGAIPDETICLGPANDPSPAAMDKPAYLSCDERIVPTTPGVEDPNGVYPENCIVLYATNEAPVSNETSSWGSMKANYDGE